MDNKGHKFILTLKALKYSYINQETNIIFSYIFIFSIEIMESSTLPGTTKFVWGQVQNYKVVTCPIALVCTIEERFGQRAMQVVGNW